MSGPVARLTVITLGVADMRRSITFYSALQDCSGGCR